MFYDNIYGFCTISEVLAAGMCIFSYRLAVKEEALERWNLPGDEQKATGDECLAIAHKRPQNQFESLCMVP